MKAKELIDQIQKIVDERGDADVRIACMGTIGTSSAKFVNDKFDVVETGQEDNIEIWLETSDIQETKESGKEVKIWEI